MAGSGGRPTRGYNVIYIAFGRHLSRELIPYWYGFYVLFRVSRLRFECQLALLRLCARSRPYAPAARDAVLDGNDFVIATKPAFPFSQRPQDVTHLEARLGTVGFHADEDRIRSGGGEVRFGVRIHATVGFKAGAWRAGDDYDAWQGPYCGMLFRLG
ncbi:uncharacterized protein A4U43_C09F14820 [Asparagus officinalis]|uniref:Uncharacterized protein n=1 Tax=Asparagus officinalis TaxID=4686 RepID=A0A5P1E822_ASPOF|nr:uncharacterized protein A4U43_C09F14820 [Asparagus officinalis]